MDTIHESFREGNPEIILAHEAVEIANGQADYEIQLRNWTGSPAAEALANALRAALVRASSRLMRTDKLNLSIDLKTAHIDFFLSEEYERLFTGFELELEKGRLARSQDRIEELEKALRNH